MPRLTTKIIIAWPIDSAEPWAAMAAAQGLRARLDALRDFVQQNGGAWEESTTTQAWTRKKGESESAAPELPIGDQTPPEISGEEPDGAGGPRDVPQHPGDPLAIPEFLRRRTNGGEDQP